MAAGYGAQKQRTLYVIPANVGGLAAGAATADYDDLEKTPLVPAEVDAFVVVANRLRGMISQAGGALSQEADEFSEWGEQDPYSLGGDSSRADITVTAAVRYDDANTDGLHLITKLVMKMEVDQEIAVITGQTVRDLDKNIRRVVRGTVQSRGEISDDNPSQMTFTFKPVADPEFIKAA